MKSALAFASARRKFRPSMRPRAVIAVGLVAAFLAAVTLASSPRLHDRLHPGGAQHECAATMIAAGNCEHTAAAPLLPEFFNCLVRGALLSRDFAFVGAAVVSSVLEHAPPPAY
jgi:hypothetical protein